MQELTTNYTYGGLFFKIYRKSASWIDFTHLTLASFTKHMKASDNYTEDKLIFFLFMRLTVTCVGVKISCYLVLTILRC